MRFRAVPVTSLEDATVDFEQLQGILFAQNPARAYRSTAFTLTAGAWTKIPVDTTTDDPGGNFDVTTNHRYNVPVAGRYQINGQANPTSTASGQAAIAGLYRNGSLVAEGNTSLSSATTGLSTVASDVASCSAGDYLELWCFCTSALALGVGPYANYLSVVRVA